MQSSISIVIVNWNAGAQLADCVDSILESSITKFSLDKIVVVDNHSTDNSLTLLPEDDKLLIIRNKINHGFGKACNIGANHVNSEYILFLNPDTRLNIKTLDNTVDFYNLNAESLGISILGIRLLNIDGTVQKTCSRFPSLTTIICDSIGLSKIFKSIGSHMKEFDHLQNQPVDQVMGAFFFLKLRLFSMLKQFDESFFVYYEEVDFSYRASKLGYKSYFLTDASAMHVGGGCSQQVKASRLFYSLNSRLVYTKKHFTKVNHIFVCFLTLFVELFSRATFSLITSNLAGLKETLRGYKMLYRKIFIK